MYSLLYLNENILATGDDDGVIKVLLWLTKIWDTRSKELVFSADDQKEGTISQMAAHSSMHYLLATSTSGYLGVYDLRKGQNSKEKLYALSDQMEEEYHCLALVKNESRVLVGTASGAVAVFHWDWFGDCKDRIIGHPEGIEAMTRFNDDVIITGGEDGWIRVVSLYPNSVNMFQKHADDLEESMPITKLDTSHDNKILASISTDCSINFFDMTEIEEEVQKLNFGEKIQLEQDMMYEPVKKELMTKGGKTENKEKRALELKKKVEFFKDM